MITKYGLLHQQHMFAVAIAIAVVAVGDHQQIKKKKKKSLFWIFWYIIRVGSYERNRFQDPHPY